MTLPRLASLVFTGETSLVTRTVSDSEPMASGASSLAWTSTCSVTFSRTAVRKPVSSIVTV